MKRSAWRYLWSAQDIRRKLLVTLLLLANYRLAAHAPVPGANRAAIEGILTRCCAGGTLLVFENLLSGVRVANVSVFKMSVYTFISFQIILLLLVPIQPRLQRDMKNYTREDQKLMEKCTYILTVTKVRRKAI